MAAPKAEAKVEETQAPAAAPQVSALKIEDVTAQNTTVKPSGRRFVMRPPAKVEETIHGHKVEDR